jgi:hypothetical protein
LLHALDGLDLPPAALPSSLRPIGPAASPAAGKRAAAEDGLLADLYCRLLGVLLDDLAERDGAGPLERRWGAAEAAAGQLLGRCCYRSGGNRSSSCVAGGASSQRPRPPRHRPGGRLQPAD